MSNVLIGIIGVILFIGFVDAGLIGPGTPVVQFIFPVEPGAWIACARELAVFGTTGFIGDREGLAILATGDRTGFIVAGDQCVSFAERGLL